VCLRILTAVYEDRDGWELNVMCANGTMFFEEYLSTAKLLEKSLSPFPIPPMSLTRPRENMTPQQRLQAYYGYAFEAHCTSSAPPQGEGPLDPPGWGGYVNTNVQWCCVAKTKLGDTRIVIGGEVDCARGVYSFLSSVFGAE
jgi:RAT1-interacting protein